MIRAYHFAVSHRPHAQFDHSAEVPRTAALYIEPDQAPLYAESAAKALRGRPFVLQLGVTVERAPTAAWRAYCEERYAALEQVGLLRDAVAVQIGEELFGRFPGVSDQAVVGWLNDTALPIARQVFRRMTWVLEQDWLNRPMPKADVIGIDPYIPAWALRAGQDDAVWRWFVERPVLALAKHRPTLVVGQAFRAAGDPLWAIAPPRLVVAQTRALAEQTPNVVALSWFCWGSLDGVTGARDLPGYDGVWG